MSIKRGGRSGDEGRGGRGGDEERGGRGGDEEREGDDESNREVVRRGWGKYGERERERGSARSMDR